MLRSVRSQVIGSMVVLLTCGFAVSGLLDYSVQLDQVDSRVNADLQQEIREFEELAARGVDPDTGDVFSDLDEVLAVGVDAAYPEADLRLVGLVDGRVAHVQSALRARDAVDSAGENRPLDLRVEPEAVRAILAARPGQEFVDVGTTQGTVRALSITVTHPDDPDRSGLFAAVYLLDAEREEVTSTLSDRVLVMVVVIVVVGLVGWFVAGRLLSPLRELSLATQQISDDRPSLRVKVRGDDEIAELGRRFNGMLDRLERALTSQRDLLNDVSHELRTPVTIVRGHLDLLDATDPADVAATRALVLEELERMSRLVDDLITLAKSDRPDFVQPAPVDITVLTDEVAQRLVALGNQTWRVEAIAEGSVALDRDRIVQALTQLASNAVRYTLDGGVVALGTARVHGDAGPRLHLWIRDTGPGVDPADVDRVFDRFARGSAEAPHTGTGLGLAIVQAVARGHGGGVRLDNRPGYGATFVLDLPWVDAAPPHGVDADALDADALDPDAPGEHRDDALGDDRDERPHSRHARTVPTSTIERSPVPRPWWSRRRGASDGDAARGDALFARPDMKEDVT